MSDNPVDDTRMRLTLTPETQAWLSAHKRTTGEAKEATASRLLHEMALKSIRAANVLHAMLRVKGLDGAAVGRQGPEWEATGWGDQDNPQGRP